MGIAGDVLGGDPPNRWHPVAWFGSVAAWFERRWYADSRGRGVLHAASTVGLAAGVGSLLPLPLVTTMALGGSSLAGVANDIGGCLARGDLDAARGLLPSLVGRDPEGLTGSEIARAVVESVAENSVDAVVAPLWWAVLGGSGGVAAHRAVNTLDAMVGHRNTRYARFGWASARADDVAAWLPARLLAVSVALLRPHRATAVWRAVRDQAPAHPSPNSGVAEAAFAAALGVTLGGQNRYGNRIEDRGVLGSGPPPVPGDIARAVRLLRELTALCMVGCVLGTLGLRRRGQVGKAPWRPSPWAKRAAPVRVSPESMTALPMRYSFWRATSVDMPHCS